MHGRLRDGDDPFTLIHRYGQTPLPHYITDTHAEPERYQTVYAKREKENSVAAPTAGLHFTPGLLRKLTDMGVPHAFVTLQVGLGTFRPVKAENIAEHVMHTEFCEIPPAAAAINETKEREARRSRRHDHRSTRLNLSRANTAESSPARSAPGSL
ncbi:MAG: S-adenosylmethionine:tRNA ribosyltransferase-isomerase [Cloacibacillus evryensis]